MARFEIRGRRQVRDLIRALERMDNRLPRRMSRLFEEIAGLAREGFAMQFRRSGAEFGSAWAPLSAATVAIKEARGFPANRILVRTGNLIASLTRRGGASAQRRRGNLLMLESTASSKGRSLVLLHERASGRRPARPIRDPQTGVGGRTLREIDRAAERMADQLLEALDGRSG